MKPVTKTYTKEDIQSCIKHYENLKKKYKGYPGGPEDDGILHLPGCYSVRGERRYLNIMIKLFKEGLSFLERHNTSQAEMTWTGRWTLPTVS